MASVTYLNIAVKIVYWLIFEQVWQGPPLMSRKGFFYWTGVSDPVPYLTVRSAVLISQTQLQTIGWAISFIIGTAIPQVQTIQGLIAAAILLNFSYTLPPIMQLSFDVQADASHGDGIYDPVTGVNRADSWHSAARWKRGFFTGGIGRVLFKFSNLLMFFAALATSGLGIWGSVSAVFLDDSNLRLLTIIETGRDNQGNVRLESSDIVWLCGTCLNSPLRIPSLIDPITVIQHVYELSCALT